MAQVFLSIYARMEPTSSTDGQAFSDLSSDILHFYTRLSLFLLDFFSLVSRGVRMFETSSAN